MCGYSEALAPLRAQIEVRTMLLKVAGGRFVAGGAHGTEMGGVIDTHAVVDVVADV